MHIWIVCWHRMGWVVDIGRGLGGDLRFVEMARVRMAIVQIRNIAA